MNADFMLLTMCAVIACHEYYYTMQTQLDALIAIKDYEQAFQKVLSASDLSLVMYLLERLPDSSEVLCEPCPLAQPTLLSLIQQLALGLSSSSPSQLDVQFE